MLSEQEAQSLMEELISLRNIAERTKEKRDINKLKLHENLCIEKFKYLVTMRTNRYKGFINYDDLNQEGMEALLKAMKNYNPGKSCFFWWAHKYIATRVSRSANRHTVIRYPLKFAVENTPHRESALPVLIEMHDCPDKNFERGEIVGAIKSALIHLSDEQRDVVNLAFGFDGDRPLSISRICKMRGISRIVCVRIINDAIEILKQYIEV